MDKNEEMDRLIESLKHLQNVEVGLERACRLVNDIFGTCPNDQYEWSCETCGSEECKNMESDNIWECWRGYFDGGGE